jgi:hypothetical protein
MIGGIIARFPICIEVGQGFASPEFSFGESFALLITSGLSV